MFNRIRYAAHVLSSARVDPYKQPGIRFEEERVVDSTRISRAVGGIVEVILFSFLIGTFAAPVLAHLWPLSKVSADVNRTTAILAAILGMLAMYCVDKFQAEIRRHLKIGDRVAPYFGHRFTRTVRTLRS
jgi:hypothetical protein